MIVFFFTSTEPKTCYEGQIILSDTAVGYGCTGDNVTTGRVEVCVDEELVPVCNNSLTPELAQRICQDQYGPYSCKK